jgi:hypothetical protein
MAVSNSALINMIMASRIVYGIDREHRGSGATPASAFEGADPRHGA